MSNSALPTARVADGSLWSRRAVAATGLAAVGVGVLATTAQADPPDGAGTVGSPRSVGSLDQLRDARPTAHGEWVNLLGVREDLPGIGGGQFFWDADSSAEEDGGTVVAFRGSSTGRWRRPVAADVEAAWFGVTGLGDADDSARLQAAVDALPDGGKVVLGPGITRIEHTITVRTVPITFVGAGAANHDALPGLGTEIVVATGDQDGFVLSGTRGGGFRDLQMRGDGLTGGALIRTQREGSDGVYFLTVDSCRFRDGFNGIILRGANTVRFANTIWSGFSGEQVVLLNGVDSTSRADPVEFVQCAISAGSANDATDNVVIDGQGGSIKFVEVAVLFGRHGIWMRNTTGEGLPKFLYFEGGGFENGSGVPVLLDAGAQAQFVNTYVSADNLSDAIRISEGFTGSAIIADSVIRGCGRHGIDIASTRVTVSGCLIGNNGRGAHAAFSVPVTAVATSDGGVVLTTATAHGWETGDRVTVSDVVGAPEINGTWRVAVVEPTVMLLEGATLSGVYGGGGIVFRHGAGINVRSTASRVVITGNAIGSLADGVSRQDYGVVSEAQDVLVSANDLTGNEVGPYLLLGSGDRSRMHGNRGVEQIDGWLSVHVDGDVENGDLDLRELLFVDGVRLALTRVTSLLQSGTCTVALDGLDGTSADVTSELRSDMFESPVVVDGRTEPRRLRLTVSRAAGASGLDVQLGYQVFS